MSTNEKSYKTGHPVLGIVLGILGIIAALLLCIFAGVIGGVIAGVLGLAAILIGLNARKYGKGIGAIITGVLAIVLAISLTVGAIDFYKEVQRRAAETGKAPLLTKYLSKPELGFFGLISSVPTDEASLQDLTNELDALTKTTLNDAETAAPAATDAPAQ